MTDEWWIVNNTEWSSSGVREIMSRKFSEGMRKTTKALSQDNLYRDRDSKGTRPEWQSGALHLYRRAQRSASNKQHVPLLFCSSRKTRQQWIRTLDQLLLRDSQQRIRDINTHIEPISKNNGTYTSSPRRNKQWKWAVTDWLNRP
jgi:hypothetical protein